MYYNLLKVIISHFKEANCTAPLAIDRTLRGILPANNLLNPSSSIIDLSVVPIFALLFLFSIILVRTTSNGVVILCDNNDANAPVKEASNGFNFLYLLYEKSSKLNIHMLKILIYRQVMHRQNC